MIKVGDRLPAGSFPRQERRGGDQRGHSVDELFKGQKVVFVGVPGAFTSTCHYAHIPQFVANAATFKDNGIDRIVVMAVNDAFVMQAWGEALGAEDKLDFVADGNGDYAKALGLDDRPVAHRARHARQALLDAGRGRRGEDAQLRAGRRQGHPGDRRRHHAEPDLGLTSISGRADRHACVVGCARLPRLLLLLLRLERRHAFARQLVGALVALGAGMALDPVPGDRRACGGARRAAATGRRSSPACGRRSSSRSSSSRRSSR